MKDPGKVYVAGEERGVIDVVQTARALRNTEKVEGN